MPKLIGIFGGTFDPIHYGHLRAVELVCQQIPFERVHWVLSARPPHKNKITASIEHRFAMLALALADNSRYIADDSEIKRRTKSYTIDTVESFKEHDPNAQLIVIIGGDSLHDLTTWHRYPELINSVNWVVMRRPGFPLDVPHELAARFVSAPDELQHFPGGKIWCCELSNFAVSSTQLRDELSSLADQAAPSPLIKEFMPSTVLNYIREHQLYTISRNPL